MGVAEEEQAGHRDGTLFPGAAGPAGRDLGGAALLWLPVVIGASFSRNPGVQLGLRGPQGPAQFWRM